MNILHLITSLHVGGAQAALYNVLEHYQADPTNQDRHWVVYLRSGPYDAKIKSLGITTYPLKGFVSVYDPLAWFRLGALLYKNRPDVIHAALWSANIMARILGFLLRIPVICDLHGDPEHHGKIRNLLEKKTLFLPTRFVAVSHSVQKSFIHLFQKKKYVSARTCVIQNGIDVEKIRQRAEQNPVSRKNFGIKKDDFVIGTVGRLHAIKRYDLLIKAFSVVVKNNKQKRSLWLCLVGDGEERRALEKLVKNVNLQNQVIFVGEQENTARYYPLFDCFVLSSVSEGLSIALLEALCFGLPVVTTHVDGVHDVITDGINGFVVPLNNVKELSEALARLSADDTLVSFMKTENIQLVQKAFSLTMVAQRYKELYCSVVAQGR